MDPRVKEKIKYSKESLELLPGDLLGCRVNDVLLDRILQLLSLLNSGIHDVILSRLLRFYDLLLGERREDVGLDFDLVKLLCVEVALLEDGCKTKYDDRK